MNCINCLYWVENLAAGGGNCHRYAPKPTAKVEVTNWPKTLSTDWCGEHTLVMTRDGA